jgi:hypothetical protein
VLCTAILQPTTRVIQPSPFRVTANQRSPLIHFAASSNKRILIQCIAGNVKFLLAIYEEALEMSLG